LAQRETIKPKFDYLFLSQNGISAKIIHPGLPGSSEAGTKVQAEFEPRAGTKTD